MPRLSLRRSASVVIPDTDRNLASHTPSEEHGQEDGNSTRSANVELSGFAAFKAKVKGVARKRYHGREKALQAIAAEGRAKPSVPSTIDNWHGTPMDDVRAWNSMARNQAKQHADAIEAKKPPGNRAATEKERKLTDELRVRADEEAERESQMIRTAEAQARRPKRTAEALNEAEVKEDKDSRYSVPSTKSASRPEPPSNTPASQPKSPSRTPASRSKSQLMKSKLQHNIQSSACISRSESPSSTGTSVPKSLLSSTYASQSKSMSSTCTCYSQDSSVTGISCTKCIGGVILSTAVKSNVAVPPTPPVSTGSADTDSTTRATDEALSPEPVVDDAPSGELAMDGTPSAEPAVDGALWPEPAVQQSADFWSKQTSPPLLTLHPTQRPQSSMSMCSSLLSRASNRMKQKLRGSGKSRTPPVNRPTSRAESRVMTVHDDDDNDLDDTAFSCANATYNFDPDGGSYFAYRATHGSRPKDGDDTAVEAWNQQVPAALRYPRIAQHAPQPRTNPRRTQHALPSTSHSSLAQHTRSRSSAITGSALGLIAGARTCHVDFQDFDDDEVVRGAPVPGSFPGALAAKGTARRREQDEMNEMNQEYDMARSISRRGHELGYHYAPSPGPNLLRSMSVECLAESKIPVDRQYAVESRMANYRELDPSWVYCESSEDYASASPRPSTSMATRSGAVQTPHSRSQSALRLRTPGPGADYSVRPRVQKPMSVLGGSTQHSNGFRAPGNMVYHHMLDEEYAPKPIVTSYARSGRRGARSTHSRMISLLPVYEDEIASQHGSVYSARSHAPKINPLRDHINESRMGHYRRLSISNPRVQHIPRSTSAAGLYRPPTAMPSRANVRERDYPAARPGSAASTYAPSTVRPGSAAGSFVRNASRASIRSSSMLRGPAYDEQTERVTTPLMQQLYAENFR